MNESSGPPLDPADQTELLANLLRISAGLTASSDRREMLETILTEARRLSGAQAGSLYVRSGRRLEFVVAQNDAMPAAGQALIGRSVRIGEGSITGLCAAAGQAVNVPDVDRPEAAAAFRAGRDFDAANGYLARSVLAIPLKCPSGEVVGVLQLINCLEADGKVGPFPAQPCPALMSLASMAAVSVHNVLLAEQLRREQLDTITRLSVVAEFRDRGTAEHIQRISEVCVVLADTLGLPEGQIELIRYASTMHDIGKVGIPDSILLKPGRLSEEERRIVETHSLIGADILGSPTNELLSMARDIALSHHERWDGRGYPRCLRGENIPLPARIVCLADVFDALSTKRCYKEAFPIDKVIEIIRSEDGRHFDPRVTEAFFRAFDRIAEHYRLAEAPAAAG